MQKYKWFKTLGEHSTSPLEANAACGTEEGLANINPPGRAGFDTPEQANASLDAWLANNPAEDKKSFVLIETFH